MIFTSIIWIYILAAVLPAAVLLIYIYKMDSVEREPAYLLFQLLLCGVGAALASMLLEYLGEGILSSFLDTDSPKYTVVLAFLVVAVTEEGTKFIFLYRRTWNDANFNFRFDGIVYSVFVSLGFAAFENITYVFNYGLSVAPARAVLAIPAHMGFSVFMGLFYGYARLAADDGRTAAKRFDLAVGYLSAVFLHGFYDSCAMLQSAGTTTIFLVFVAAMFISAFRLIRRSAKTDTPV